VDRLCSDLFLAARARERDDNLLFVRERLLRSEVDRVTLLDTYGRVRSGKRVADEESNGVVTVLRLSGAVKGQGGWLRVRNRIYGQVFDREWLTANMPDAELRRQKMAYRKGFIRAAALSAGFMVITGGLAWTAIRESAQARKFASVAYSEKMHAFVEAETARQNLYWADMSLAQQAWAEKSYGRVQELLEEFRPQSGQTDLRRFEWWLLWSRCHLDLPFMSCGSVGTVGYAKDGAILRTSDGHGNARYWDARDGKALPDPAGKSFDIHYAAETGVGYTERPPHENTGTASPDGRYRAVGRFYWKEDPEYQNASVRLLDAHTGATLHTFKGVMAAYAFSPDSKLLAAESLSGNVLVWDTATGALARTLYGAEGPFAFSPDGKRLAAYTHAYGEDGVKIYDVAKSREPRRLPGYGDQAALSADGRFLSTLDYSHGHWQGVTVRDAQTERSLRSFPDAQEPMALSPHGEILASGTPGNNGGNGLVSLWDTADGRALGQIKVGDGEVQNIIFSPDGKLIAVLAQGVKLINAATHREMADFPDVAGAPAFSPDGKLLAVPIAGKRNATPGAAEEVVIWDIAQSRPGPTLVGAHGPVAFSPMVPWLVAGGPNNTLQLWDSTIGRAVKGEVFQGLRHPAYTCAFSRNGQRLAAGDGIEYNVILWDAMSGHETFHIPGRTERTDVTSYSLFFAGNDAKLYCGNQDDAVKGWESVPQDKVPPFTITFSAPVVIKPFKQE
jgi:WD40 repeat protein